TDELDGDGGPGEAAHTAAVVGQGDRGEDVDDGREARQPVRQWRLGRVTHELDAGARGGRQREDDVDGDDEEPGTAGGRTVVGGRCGVHRLLAHACHSCHIRSSMTMMVKAATTRTTELQRVRSTKAARAAPGRSIIATSR